MIIKLCKKKCLNKMNKKGKGNDGLYVIQDFKDDEIQGSENDEIYDLKKKKKNYFIKMKLLLK